MSTRILVGDALTVLRTLPSASVSMCCTSPPYYSLRDYQCPGQIGLERSPDEYIAKLVEVFAEVRRVLRDDGTLWLNIGDSYAGSGKGPSNSLQSEASQLGKTGALNSGFNERWGNSPGQRKQEVAKPARRNSAQFASGQAPTAWVPVPQGVKPKDLLLIPFRLALALQADGWYVRSDIAWCKRSCMPESVQDRPTNAWEHVFLLSKQARYFYDQEAVREINPEASRSWGATVVDEQKAERPDGYGQGRLGRTSMLHARSREDKNAYRGTANMRNFWLLGPEPFSEAHFATFVPEIPRRAILAGCPVGGTVLDCFGGAGTTALVADRLGRNAILVELNPEYAAMAQRRISGESPMFSEVSVA